MGAQILIGQTFDTWAPGRDTAVLTLGTQEPNSVLTDCVINAKGAEWGLKMPGNIGSSITGTTLTGGKERALDIVRGSNIRFMDCVFSNGSDRKVVKSKWSFSSVCDVGIKGGATNIGFYDCVMTDLLLGDHCIYDNPGVGAKTNGIILENCRHPAGENTPIILRILNAEPPQLVNTNAVALVYWGPIVKIYFWIAGKWIDSREPVQ